MLSDLRFAFRQLINSPGFSFVAILTIAVAIGVNTAIFSVINSALIRPLGYSQPAQLAQVYVHPGNGGIGFGHVTGPEFELFREHASKLASVAGYNSQSLNFSDGKSAQRVRGLEVSANFLTTLRVVPLHGHNFESASEKVGGPNHVIILSYEWWQSQFAGDRHVVDRTIILDRVSYTVAGVLPQGALFDDSAKFLIPLVMGNGAWRMAPDSPWLPNIVRLNAGVSLKEAQSEIQNLDRALHARLIPQTPYDGLSLEPFQATLVEKSRATLLMLQGAVVLVLLIASANIANLLLARATPRTKEMAVRFALGASRGRIVRQMLTESLVLSFIGGIVGLGFAVFSLDLLSYAVAGVLPNLLAPTLNVTVLSYSVALVGGTGILFGCFPALRARGIDVNQGLKEASRGSTGGRSRAQSLLIVGEIALTAMLLIGAGLLLRSFARVLSSNPGFDPHHSLICDLSVSSPEGTPAGMNQFRAEVLRRVAALPGVEAVGTVTNLPLSGEGWAGRIGLSEQPVAQFTNGSGLDFIDGDFFRAMGMHLLKGRVFTEAENSTPGRRIAVINAALADAILPGQNPIGRHVRVVDEDWEIVGVVESARHNNIDETAWSHVYLPHLYNPYIVRLVVRTRVAPRSLAEPLRATIASIDATQTVSKVRTFEEAISLNLKERKVALFLLGLFALMAMGMAAVGIYGVIAYTIGQRQRELNIRMALGAQARDIRALVLRDGFAMGAAGIVIGLAGGAIGARLIASRLYEVDALDPVIFTSVAVVVSTVVLAAITLPALKASKSNSIISLHAE